MTGSVTVALAGMIISVIGRAWIAPAQRPPTTGAFPQIY